LPTSWARDGRLSGRGVVATVMSNLGLERYLTGRGLASSARKVGDRYVVERMRSDGYNGRRAVRPHHHVRHATTGDGLIAALQASPCRSIRTGKPASEVFPLRAGAAGAEERARRRGQAAARTPRRGPAIADAEAKLGKNGRLSSAPPAPSR
jgi:phosphoglucosamine mutase